MREVRKGEGVTEAEQVAYLKDVVRKVYDMTGYRVPEELHRNSCGDHHIRWNFISAMCAKALRETEAP